MGNNLSNIGKGFASLVGASEYVTTDTISQLNSSLSTAKDEQNKFIQNANLEALKGEFTAMNDIVEWSQVNNKLLAETENYQYVMLNGRFENTTTFVILLFLVIIIIVFYLILKKKCC